MRPISKRLLIHTATLYQRVNVDKWGKGELNGGQELSNIRIQEASIMAGHAKTETTMLYCNVDQESVKYHHKKYLSA